jgi:hypothetical protein
MKQGKTTNAAMGSLPEVTGPGQFVSVDITGPYETFKRGNRYLLTYIDHFTKWNEAVALPNQEAARIAKAIVTKIFSRHGVCDTLHSDRGKNFTSSLLKERCQLLGARKIFTSPYRPQCYGQVENFHRTLHQSLTCSIEARGRECEEWTDYVLWAFWAQPHSVTKYSPYHLTHGREMAGPHGRELAAYLQKRSEPSDVKEAVGTLARKLRHAHRMPRQNIRNGKETQINYHDRKARPVTFTPGQLVYRRCMKKGRKLSPKYTGPYEVKSRLSELVHQIAGPKGHLMNINVEQMKPCHTDAKGLRRQRRTNRKRRERKLTKKERAQTRGEGESNPPEDEVAGVLGSRVPYIANGEETPDNGNANPTPDPSAEGGTEDRPIQPYNLRPRKAISYRL